MCHNIFQAQKTLVTNFKTCWKLLYIYWVFSNAKLTYFLKLYKFNFNILLIYETCKHVKQHWLPLNWLLIIFTSNAFHKQRDKPILGHYHYEHHTFILLNSLNFCAWSMNTKMHISSKEPPRPVRLEVILAFN